MHHDVIVVGAGAAGLLAAAVAAERGLRVLLLEKNRRPGIKILMSGGTRCNITHDTDVAGILAAFGKPGRFLHSALAALGPRELVNMFNDAGVATKVEPGGKVFPVSDRATDVLEALLTRLTRSGAELRLGEAVSSIGRTSDGAFRLTSAENTWQTPKLLLCTGGRSYPGSGTTGDAYPWAAQFGHTIVPPRPALTPLLCEAAWVRALTGLTIPDVYVRVVDPNEPDRKRATLAERRASFLFAHFGLSGPAPMDVSRAVSGHARPQTLTLLCDFLPEVRDEAISEQLQQSSGEAGRRSLVHALGEFVPSRLAAALLEVAQIPADRRMAELAKAERSRVVELVKRCPIPLSGTRGYAKAEVTAGGVALDEIDSQTMQSKLVPGLYFAGELLDLDGPIGGYNFQAAFSTGYLAGLRL
jgi:predicted Rossmann fold flavoprotein